MSDSKHHHHHHHHHRDEAEDFKQHQLRAMKTKKIVKNVAFYTLVVIAILVMAVVAWVYTH